jgi:ankyrin repeat protein
MDINTPNEYGWTPLFHAAKHNQLEIAKYLLSKGAKAHLFSTAGITPLHLATGFQRNHEMVRLLLAHGADVNAKGHGDDTPLHQAAKDSKEPEVVKELIAHGADVNARNKRGRTPLMESCYVPEITKHLIDKGAIVNQQDVEGRTALFFTVYYRCYASARVLINSGAAPQIKDMNGNSPWKIVQNRHNKEDKKLARLFLKSSGKPSFNR